MSPCCMKKRPRRFSGAAGFESTDTRKPEERSARRDERRRSRHQKTPLAGETDASGTEGATGEAIRALANLEQARDRRTTPLRRRQTYCQAFS